MDTMDRPADVAGPALRALLGGGDAGPTRETILLVEDEDGVRAVTRLTLQLHGYRVLEARSGAEAEAASRQAGEIHLLITDIRLPDADGLAVAERLADSRPGLRVLLVSGDPEAAADRPGVAFLPKPFTPPVLVNKVREVLSPVAVP